MRTEIRKDGFSLRAISGTRAVLLAMDAREEQRQGLLGFAVGRRTGPRGGIRWLNGFKCFRELVPDPEPGQRFQAFHHPIQSFLWGFYAAEPGKMHHFVVRPLFRPEHGDLERLRPGPNLEVSLSTESETGGKHSILFNRGAIVSQGFAERFGDEELTRDELTAVLNDPQAERTQWLSRGLLEGALAFIDSARDQRDMLQCAFYELTYPPILERLAAAAARGVRVEVVYESGHHQLRRDETLETSNGQRNKRAIEPYRNRANLHFLGRTRFVRITHNKFMLLSRKGRPEEVWTGSANITPSGFLGQSNTGHIVRDGRLAESFRAYFSMLAKDSDRASLRAWNQVHSPNPHDQLPEGSTAQFSPRVGLSMLHWYADQMDSARESLILTSAFGVTPILAERFDNERDYLRYVLMEQKSQGEGAQEKVERDPNTHVVFGQGLGTLGSRGSWRAIPGWQLEGWMRREEHYRTFGNVFFVHTKYMGIDILGDDPRIFTGSANFSPAAVNDNDENMLLIRGDKSVADVYTTEFFRLLNHFYFRQVANRRAQDGTADPNIRFLDPTDSWVAGHFRQQNYRSKRRELFGVAP